MPTYPGLNSSHKLEPWQDGFVSSHNHAISLVQLPHKVRRPNQSYNDGILYLFIRSHETNSNVALHLLDG